VCVGTTLFWIKNEATSGLMRTWNVTEHIDWFWTWNRGADEHGLPTTRFLF